MITTNRTWQGGGSEKKICPHWWSSGPIGMDEPTTFMEDQ